MSNHIHLIISTSNGNLSDILRDFKKFTSKEIITTIENNKQESRKNWMLWIFKKAGEKNSRNKEFQFWQQDNHAIQLETVEFTLDRLTYMHNNPVKAGLEEKAEEYLLGSARNYYYGKGGLLQLQDVTLTCRCHQGKMRHVIVSARKNTSLTIYFIFEGDFAWVTLVSSTKPRSFLKLYVIKWDTEPDTK